MNGDVVHALLRRHLGIASPEMLAATLRLLLETGLRAVEADEGSLLILNAEAQDLRFAMTVGNAASEAVLLDQRVPVGAGITGLAAQRREVQIGAPSYAHIDQSGQVESVLAAPVLAGREVAGVITAVLLHKGRRFDAEAAQTFGAFAVIAGVLIHQAQQISKTA